MLSKPEHPPLTTEALVTWLRTQPPEQTYVWSDPVFCLMGSYLADHGSSWGVTAYSEMPNYHEIAAERPWTFGAALERAEKFLLASPSALPASNAITADAMPALPAPETTRELVPAE
jgi:hypothetical protein